MSTAWRLAAGTRSKMRDARTGLWHLRKGGVSQVLRWRRQKQSAGANPVTGQGNTLLAQYPAIVSTGRKPAFPSIRVGTILDDFSSQAFAFEWETVPLDRDGWLGQLSGLDFVFIESAWKGNSGSWSYQLTGTSGLKDDARELLTACTAKGIPTVFWNKEDPPHFEDFIEAASHFDWVFTSDCRLVDEYRTRLGHERVGTLRFAAQPAIHNPVRPAGERRESGVAFAGMYFAHKYPERKAQMDWLLTGAADAAARVGESFDVFSRQLGGDERYQFPPPVSEHVVGSLPYEHMPTAYKSYSAFLNVNSVVDSPSMCARRIFEIAASGTPVVSAPSAATRQFFPPHEVFQPTNREEAAHSVRALLRSTELRDRSVHLAQRRIWREHTYSHRAMEIMDAVGIDYSDPTARSCTVIVSTNRPEQIDHVVESVARQTGISIQLSLVTHGYSVNGERLRRRCDELGISDLVVQEADSSLSLGECLNLAFDAAHGDTIAKFDDDDLYGQHYLADQVAALRYSGADLVGKQAHYMHLSSTDTMLLRFPEREHKFTDLVMGPTMVGTRDAFARTRFQPITRGEDTTFLRRLAHAGGTIYSSDRFNFVQVRSASGGHTWAVEESELLATGIVHGYGLAPEHHFF